MSCLPGLLFEFAGDSTNTWLLGLALQDSGSSNSTPGIERFHDWRVRSTHFISKLETHDRDKAIATAVHNMVDSLKTIASSAISHGQVEHMRQDATGIMHKAAELDKIFRLSKAHFHVFITRVKLPLVSPPKFNFGFDPETMECIETIPISDLDGSVPAVDLAVSPGIFKAGNADGANYGTERVLVKLRALCHLQATMEFFGETQSVEEEQKPVAKAEGVYFKQEDLETDGEVDFIQPKSELMS